MKIARMLIVLALTMSTGQVVNGQDRSRTDQEQARRDQLRIAVQEICPTSGNKLGEHGDPIKVTVGKEKEEVFLCCKGCLKQKLDPKHWTTIHANFAKAQRICPIMKKKLPKNPKWVVVQGQIVYTCCPPCVKKILADPITHLRKIDELYMASLKTKRIRR